MRLQLGHQTCPFVPFDKTVFMSINGTIGNVAMFQKERLVLGKSAAYFNITSSSLLKDYLYFYLQSGSAHLYYSVSMTGSTIKNLGLKVGQVTVTTRILSKVIRKLGL